MTLPLPLLIGLRYVRARKSQFFVSFITWVSLLLICVAVAFLILILSVMNGFEGELRARLLSLSAHATLSGSEITSGSWHELAARAQKVAGVVGVAPYVELQGLIAHEPELSGVTVRGIDPQAEPSVSTLGGSMVDGQLTALVPGRSQIILGRVLAYQMSVVVGDSVTVMIPVGSASGEGLNPRIQSFTVAGIFEVGLQDHDSVLAFVHLEDALALRGGGTQLSGLRLRFADVFAAPTLAPRVARAVGGALTVSDWTRDNANYFRAIRIEKTVMTVLLLLIVAVAAFNIVSTLVMVVTDKRTDIAILRTLGLQPRRVLGIFVTQGVIIGWLGTLLGVGLGVVLALTVSTVAPFLQRVFGFQIMDADVFYITAIPSDLRPPDVVLVGVVALMLTVLATLYPAWRAARTEPAEALRYE